MESRVGPVPQSIFHFRYAETAFLTTRVSKEKKDTHPTGDTSTISLPVVVIDQKSLVMGTLSAIVQMKPNHDVVLLSTQSKASDVARALMGYKYKNAFINASTVGLLIAHVPQMSFTQLEPILSCLQQAFALLQKKPDWQGAFLWLQWHDLSDPLVKTTQKDGV